MSDPWTLTLEKEKHLLQTDEFVIFIQFMSEFEFLW